MRESEKVREKEKYKAKLTKNEETSEKEMSIAFRRGGEKKTATKYHSKELCYIVPALCTIEITRL